MSDEIAGRWLHRCLCLLIVALAVKNPDYKIPDADEREQRSEGTPKENPAPVAEHAVEDQIGPTMQRDVPCLPMCQYSKAAIAQKRSAQINCPHHRVFKNSQRLSIARFPLVTYVSPPVGTHCEEEQDAECRKENLLCDPQERARREVKTLPMRAFVIMYRRWDKVIPNGRAQ